MAKSGFKIESKLTLRDGDLLLLTFDGSKPLFKAADLHPEIRPVRSEKRDQSWVTVYAGKLSGKRLLVLATDLKSKDRELVQQMKIAVSKAVACCRREGLRRIQVPLSGNKAIKLSAAVHEGAVLGGHCFDRYLAKKTRIVPVQAVVSQKQLGAARSKARQNAIVFQEVNSGRDLISEPANIATPAFIASTFRKAGKASGLQVTVWDRKRLEKENCGGVLAVGGASSVPPRMVIGRYRPTGKAARHLVLVGKGVSFDTGGYSLKLPSGMGDMKADMAGAAAVFFATCAIARLKLPLKVTVITPLVENAIGQGGFRPGDILKTRSGKTVQVDNTDAEGRLILADALDVAAGMKPDMVLDVATLTGASVVALGLEIAALFSNDSRLASAIIAASAETGEMFWELPLYRPYAKGLRGPTADIRNLAGDRWGGAIVAALFLQNWIPEDLSWAHLDIAGSVFGDKILCHLGPGGKGFGIKTLVEFAGRTAGKK
jgi:leucyl aminopeptidase